MAPWLVVALQVAAAPTCVTLGDRIACGYHCVASATQLACAQTPDGLCDKSGGHVVCWDPPPDVRRLLAADEDLPRPSCVSRGNQVACGFACARTLSRAACANTPFGACEASFGRLVCFDPAPEVRWALEDEGRLPRASCESSLSQTACGYHCESAGMLVRCAATPDGFCERHFDTLACFDPAPELQLPSRADNR